MLQAFSATVQPPTATDYRNYSATVSRFSNVTVNQPTLVADTWTTTGLFAVPGYPITVRRVDGNAMSVATSVAFWFQREAVTKAFELRSDGLCGYNRPQFARSTNVRINADGGLVTLSPPFGGPIYVQMNSLLPEGGANDGRCNVTLVFDNVAMHPTILDMGSDASGTCACCSALPLYPECRSFGLSPIVRLHAMQSTPSWASFKRPRSL